MNDHMSSHMKPKVDENPIEQRQNVTYAVSKKDNVLFINSLHSL